VALADLIEQLNVDIEEFEAELAPYTTITDSLKAAKLSLKTLETDFLKHLDAARAALSDVDCTALVLDIFRADIAAQVERYLAVHRRQVIVSVETWWDKYRVSLRETEQDRDKTARELVANMTKLGYD